MGANTSNYMDQGGSTWNIGGILDIITGGIFKIASVAVDATAAELNKLAGVVAGTVTASKALVVGASKELDTLIVSSFKIGTGGTALTQAKVYTPSLTPAEVALASSAEQTFSVSGLTTADKVFVCPPASLGDGLGIVGARVSAADTLALRFSNSTAGNLTPVAGTYTVVAIRS